MRPGRTITRVTVVGLAAAGLFASGVFAAQATGGAILGIVRVGKVQEQFRMPGGYTVRGRVGDPRLLGTPRVHHFRPDHYGKLVGITAHQDRGVLWYESDDGTVRNVVVESPERELVLIEPKESKLTKLQR